jgi:Domain of unknown function (DUF397)
MEDTVSWRKSSYSSNGGGNCVEVTSGLPGGLAVRDSKNPGPQIVASPAAWLKLTVAIKDRSLS